MEIKINSSDDAASEGSRATKHNTLASLLNTKASRWNSRTVVLSTVVAGVGIAVTIWQIHSSKPSVQAKGVGTTAISATEGSTVDSRNFNATGNSQTGKNNTQQIIQNQQNILNAAPTNPAPSVSVQSTGNNNNNVGVNNGSITQNNSSTSNVTIINVWGNTEKFHYSFNGAVPFPVDASGKMEELKKLAQTYDFKQALMPFAALGTLQPTARGMEPDKNSIARPISYAKLFELGALSPNTEGQEILIKIAIDQKDKMRPRWRMRLWQSRFWIQDPNQVQLVQNAQTWINNYHDEMIQLGILSQ